MVGWLLGSQACHLASWFGFMLCWVGLLCFLIVSANSGLPSLFTGRCICALGVVANSSSLLSRLLTLVWLPGLDWFDWIAGWLLGSWAGLLFGWWVCWFAVVPANSGLGLLCVRLVACVPWLYLLAVVCLCFTCYFCFFVGFLGWSGLGGLFAGCRPPGLVLRFVVCVVGRFAFVRKFHVCCICL